MRAVFCTEYGPPDVLQLREVEKPKPKDDEVLIKAYASTVTAGDRRVRALDVPSGFEPFMRLALGMSKPRQPILGSELAGVIEAVGAGIGKFKVGDEVFAFSDARMGCHAEFKCMPRDGAVAIKPSSLSFEEAAALSYGGTTALYFLRKCKLRSGESVLINGASGGVGTAFVQLAKYFGAEVTGVCSTANIDLIRSLGASRVIDYTKEDFSLNGQAYDVIVDTAGTAPFSRSKRSLEAGGRLLMVLPELKDMLRIPWVSMTSKNAVVAGSASARADDLDFLAKLAEEGKFRPVIDRCYTLEQIAEAHRYVDTGRKRGNVVITFGQ